MPAFVIEEPAQRPAHRVRCHVCGARVYVGETAHDVEPGDDGAERFACAEHCETCR
jgi:hypothetical protein